MRILNFRSGFATNSSSSHSVILLPPHLIDQVDEIASRSQDGFGWDFFRLTTEESKLRYLAATLFSNYARDKDALIDMVARINQEVSGYAEEMQSVLEQNDKWGSSTPYVDHQSLISFPEKYSPDLVDAMITYFRSPRVVVLGGNDNSDADEFTANYVPGAPKAEFLARITDSGRHYALRRDGEIFTLFDKIKGDKVRFSFENIEMTADHYTKSSAPELVDVKITDWCDGGCKFCYQASTKKGVHAPFEKIEAIAKTLQEMGVFEVAIGGGEPTAHPDFARILQMFREHEIMPNFTTFSDKWLTNLEIVTAVSKYVGGIGVSCLDVKGLSLIKDIKAAFKEAGLPTCQIMAQHVVGAVPVLTTTDFITAAFENYIPVLLLGFKDVGFGQTYSRHDDSSFETYVKLAVTNSPRWHRLSVDTALINLYPNLPRILGAPNALVTPREGAFSCYIDAVSGEMGASSYVKKTEMVPLPDDVETFQTIFANF